MRSEDYGASMKAPNEKMYGFNVAVQLTKRSIITQNPMYNMYIILFFTISNILTLLRDIVHAFGFGCLLKHELL